MSNLGHNNPPRVIELTDEEHAFLLENCNSNIEYGLKALDMLTSQDLLERMVKQIELFKTLRDKLRA